MSAVIAVTFLTVFSSCKKQDAAPEPVPSATITITSPAAGDVFRFGDTTKITANISCNVKMHGCDVAVVNISTGDTLFQADDHAHEMTLNVNQYWCCNLSSTADLRLYISTALNHDGLEVVETVDFKVAP